MSAWRNPGANFLTATVDVDALPLYRQIHGLADRPRSLTQPAAPPADSLDPAWAHGVPRFLALFREPQRIERSVRINEETED